ncbi:MAG: GrpB family protein [Spirochaetes bacterium]|uniref:GrpB family protein n=1 Tax=Candidatus Ornithospirochaeta stercoripullorum TaxID=2840899 RepID=A0A9D9H4V8_9SPIO|nr:GrpB family protein [Candidatus Ornithospirochaeta stercoripullorum]
MPQHVIVTPYNPTWPEIYKEEKKLLSAIVGSNLIGIYHIGSTSVPNLAAKPVIDIMITVRSLSAIDDIENLFEAAGYEALGEYGIKGRRYFRKGGEERTHQIHIFQAEDRKNIERHLAFRNYLRMNEKVRNEYEKLKTELAKKFPWDIDSYCDGKDKFIKETEEKALAVYDPTWDKLYTAARLIQNERVISPFVEAGTVAAALITDNGNIYTGVCLDTACSLGMCAERNTISTMISSGESTIKRIVITDSAGNLMLPCLACQELMMQLGKESKNTEILQDLESEKAIILGAMQPAWWGDDRYS